MKKIFKWLIFAVILIVGLSVLVMLEGRSKPVVKKESPSAQSSSTSTDESSAGTQEIVRRVTLAAAGDNLMHLEIIKDAMKPDKSGYDFTPIYQGIKDIISGADISFINQETILGGEELSLSGYPTFNSPQEVGRDLIKVGFDVVNHATNHALDRGVKGIDNTLKFWNSHPEITVTGIYENQQDRDRIRVVDRNGIKIAFLSYTYGTNGIPVPKDKPYIVNLIDKGLISRDVKKAKEEADAVVVSMHWGNEYQQTPSKEQKELASFMADLGVTLIIGHHPHVLQPMEWVKGSNGNSTLVAYSLGNLVSCQNEIPRLLGGILKVTIEKGSNGNVCLKDPEIVPVVTHYERYAKGFRVYPLSEYTDELARNHGLNRFGKNVTVAAFKNIVSSVLKGWVKTEKQGTIGISGYSNSPRMALAQDISAQDTMEHDYSNLDARIKEIGKKYGAQGMSVAIVKDGEIEWTTNCGYSDKERKIPASSDTAYRIASISKTVTGMVLMKLWDEGKVDLDRDIGDYLGYKVRNPAYPDIPITLRSLLTHTSSISDYGTYDSVVDAGKGTPLLKDILTPGSSAYSKHNYSNYAPGSGSFNYSNFGLGIVAAVVESVTGERFPQYAREALFATMGIDASYLPSDISGSDRIAVIYNGGNVSRSREQALKDKTWINRFPIGQLYGLAQGNLYISDVDLAKLMIVLMGDGTYEGKTILSNQAVDMINEVQWIGDEGINKMRGLSLHITDDLVNGRRLRGHQGRAYGAVCEMFYDNTDRTGVVFLSNGCIDKQASNGFSSIGSEIVNAVYNEIGY